MTAALKRLAGGGKATIKDKAGHDVVKGADFDFKKQQEKLKDYRDVTYNSRNALVQDQRTATTMGGSGLPSVMKSVIDPQYKFMKQFDDAQTAAGSGTSLSNTYVQGTNMVPQIGLAGKTVTGNDVLIQPDKGPIIRPAPNDVIAAFRPNDVIQRTVNGFNTSDGGNMNSMLSKLMDSMQSSKTNSAPINVNIDIKTLAQEFATAMKNIKLETNVRTDNFLGATRMNSEKRFS